MVLKILEIENIPWRKFLQGNPESLSTFIAYEDEVREHLSKEQLAIVDNFPDIWDEFGGKRIAWKRQLVILLSSAPFLSDEETIILMLFSAATLGH